LNLFDYVVARLVRATRDLGIEGHCAAAQRAFPTHRCSWVARSNRGDDDREGEMIERST
jgi:hypothetical protein